MTAQPATERPALDDTLDLPTRGEPFLPTVRMEFGAATHAGKVRSNNEDQFLVARLAKSMQVCKTSLPDTGKIYFSEEEGYLMVVADGMGGAAAGEKASALAVLSVEDFVLNTLKWFLHLGGKDEHVLFNELREGLSRADRAVIDRAAADRALRGMGTTLTMAYSVDSDLFLVHAGDSRAYLFRDGGLNQLTEDHTMVQMLVRKGTIAPEQARRHNLRNVVTNIIGGPQEGVHAEIHKLRVADGDILLLCSDGLTEPVRDEEIAAVLARDLSQDDACAQLMELALERGGPDNITIILARFGLDPDA